MHRVHGPDPAGRRAEVALARFARPGPGSNDLGEKVFCFTKEANTKAGNGNPNPQNPPIPPELLFNVPVLPLRSDVPSCAPRGDRIPGRGTRRRWGGFQRWFRRLVVGAMRKKLDTRFPAVRFNLISCDRFEFSCRILVHVRMCARMHDACACVMHVAVWISDGEVCLRFLSFFFLFSFCFFKKSFPTILLDRHALSLWYAWLCLN